MGQATLNIAVILKRMLTKAEAASHCGRPVKRFEIECPVKPVKFSNGDLRYDVHELDLWLDKLKSGQDTADVESGFADDAGASKRIQNISRPTRKTPLLSSCNQNTS